jgi:tryptophan 2,3-dioxygenase
MQINDISPDILAQVGKLEQKFEAMGQDLSSYLDGLLYANYLTYWDYIHLDTLLSLQNPKTDFPDEEIFITYHQITELYFKLILHEIKQITQHEFLTEEFFVARLQRMNRYIAHLVHTFEIMGDGMDKDQFLKFRMSLLPASGFQSGQFRMIEICATDFKYLVEKDFFKQIDTHTTVEEMYAHIYWRLGATELATGKKTLTLKQFEDKYAETFIRLAKAHLEVNFLRLFKRKFPQSETVKNELRNFDALLNIDWKLAHFGSAVRYLHKEPADIAATGGTNWQKYLPPRFQRVIFYPEIWTEEEIADWGKSWVVEKFGRKKL